jgi:hypothetical protein
MSLKGRKTKFQSTKKWRTPFQDRSLVLVRIESARDRRRPEFASQRPHQVWQQEAAFEFGSVHGWSVQPKITVAGMSNFNHVGTPRVDNELTRNE